MNVYHNRDYYREQAKIMCADSNIEFSEHLVDEIQQNSEATLNDTTREYHSYEEFKQNLQDLLNRKRAEIEQKNRNNS